MKYIVPSYYRDFTCIAGNCKHSCCIGWEIDIDHDTAEFYRTVDGHFGKRLRENIEYSCVEKESTHFKLYENERCPFLNPHGLCDIILTLGEDSLCQICSDHPRYRHFFSDRTEIGLGLCCEAAGELILFGNYDFKLITLSENDSESAPLSEDELILLDKRDQIFSLIQNHRYSLDQRINLLLKTFGKPLPDRNIAQWAEFYDRLERLEEKRDHILTSLEQASPKALHFAPDENYEIAFERLLCYFIYRHLPDALYDFRFEERISFSVLSTKMIYAAAALEAYNSGKQNKETLIELARLYSAEIEYSEENLEAILAILE